MENIKKWLTDNDYYHYYGFARGDGYGSSTGSGYGFGTGNGFNYNSGRGYGSGHCHGSGLPHGSGYGTGNDSGSGDRHGSGYGYNYCYDESFYGIGSYNGQKAYIIDGVPTLITNIHKTIAKGYILESDLSLTPCYIVKGHGYFAHGQTVKEALKALQSKIFENMNPEKTIALFILLVYIN